MNIKELNEKVYKVKDLARSMEDMRQFMNGLDATIEMINKGPITWKIHNYDAEPKDPSIGIIMQHSTIDIPNFTRVFPYEDVSEEAKEYLVKFVEEMKIVYSKKIDDMYRDLLCSVKELEGVITEASNEQNG